MSTPSDDNSTQASSRTALYAVAVLGAAALGALLYVIGARVTGYTSFGSALLGIVVSIGVFSVLADRASAKGIELSFWKYAVAFTMLAIVVNYLVFQLI